jgi:hypothetical protein
VSNLVSAQEGYSTSQYTFGPGAPSYENSGQLAEFRRSLSDEETKAWKLKFVDCVVHFN